MALLYTLISITMVLLGVSGFAVRRLRDAEARMPDYEERESQDADSFLP